MPIVPLPPPNIEDWWNEGAALEFFTNRTVLAEVVDSIELAKEIDVTNPDYVSILDGYVNGTSTFVTLASDPAYAKRYKAQIVDVLKEDFFEESFLFARLAAALVPVEYYKLAGVMARGEEISRDILEEVKDYYHVGDEQVEEELSWSVYIWFVERVYNQEEWEERKRECIAKGVEVTREIVRYGGSATGMDGDTGRYGEHLDFMHQGKNCSPIHIALGHVYRSRYGPNFESVVKELSTLNKFYKAPRHSKSTHKFIPEYLYSFLPSTVASATSPQTQNLIDSTQRFGFLPLSRLSALKFVKFIDVGAEDKLKVNAAKDLFLLIESIQAFGFGTVGGNERYDVALRRGGLKVSSDGKQVMIGAEDWNKSQHGRSTISAAARLARGKFMSELYGNTLLNNWRNFIPFHKSGIHGSLVNHFRRRLIYASFLDGTRSVSATICGPVHLIPLMSDGTQWKTKSSDRYTISFSSAQAIMNNPDRRFIPPPQGTVGKLHLQFYDKYGNVIAKPSPHNIPKPSSPRPLYSITIDWSTSSEGRKLFKSFVWLSSNASLDPERIRAAGLSYATLRNMDEVVDIIIKHIHEAKTFEEERVKHMKDLVLLAEKNLKKLIAKKKVQRKVGIHGTPMKGKWMWDYII